MEDSAIREGFRHLKPGTEYDALYEAALCRERSDWIVGINATRLFSVLYGNTLNVGRVMSPTLALTVMREAAIAAFISEPFYTVKIQMDGFTASSERIKSKENAEKLNFPHHMGICRSHDTMYSDRNPELYRKWSKTPALASDMETATVLTVAMLRGVHAASVLNTVSGFQSDVPTSVGKYADEEKLSMMGEENEIIIALEALKGVGNGR